MYTIIIGIVIWIVTLIIAYCLGSYNQNKFWLKELHNLKIIEWKTDKIWKYEDHIYNGKFQHAYSINRIAYLEAKLKQIKEITKDA